MLELINDFPPLVKIVTKPGHKTYYTLGDSGTLDLEEIFKSAHDRWNNLLYRGRFG